MARATRLVWSMVSRALGAFSVTLIVLSGSLPT